MRTGADVLHWTGFDKTTIRGSVKTQVGHGCDLAAGDLIPVG